MSDYPHTCDCGSACYRGATEVECSSRTCVHWDGKERPGLVALGVTHEEVRTIAKRELAKERRDPGLTLCKEALAIAAAANTEKDRPGPAVLGVSREKAWAIAHRELAKKSGHAIAARRREEERPGLVALGARRPNVRICSTCERSTPLEDLPSMNQQQCDICREKCISGKCRGCGKIYPCGAAPALCIPCLEKKIGFLNGARREVEGQVIRREDEIRTLRGRLASIEASPEGTCDARTACALLLGVIHERLSVREKVEEEDRICKAFTKLPREWREGKWAPLVNEVLGLGEKVEEPDDFDLVAGERVEAVREDPEEFTDDMYDWLDRACAGSPRVANPTDPRPRAGRALCACSEGAR